jgi:hypothetical protein
MEIVFFTERITGSAENSQAQSRFSAGKSANKRIHFLSLAHGSFPKKKLKRIGLNPSSTPMKRFLN